MPIFLSCLLVVVDLKITSNQLRHSTHLIKHLYCLKKYNYKTYLNDFQSSIVDPSYRKSNVINANRNCYLRLTLCLAQMIAQT